MSAPGHKTPGEIGLLVGFVAIGIAWVVPTLAFGMASLLGCDIATGGEGRCPVAGVNVSPLLDGVFTVGGLIKLWPLWALILIVSFIRLVIERAHAQ
jgi:hypothetical protein